MKHNRFLFNSLFILGFLGVLSEHSLAQSFSSLFSEKTNDGISSSVTYTAAAFGDYNNDGFLDLAISYNEPGTNNGYVTIWKNNPASPGSFTNTHYWNGPERQVAWGDFDNDGDLDLFANAGGTGTAKSYLFQNGGPAANYALSPLGGANTTLGYVNNAQGAGWFDANGDGYLDVFQSSGSSYSTIHLNNKNSGNWFTEYSQSGTYDWERYIYDTGGNPSSSTGPVVNGSYSVTADIDNDGKQDILYAIDQGSSNNRLFVWRNVTSGSLPQFDEISKYILSVPAAPTTNYIFWSGVVAWDADNDGDLDVLYVNSNGKATGYPGAGAYRDQFYENKIGYGTIPFANYADKLVLNQNPAFGNTTGRNSGGVAFGDLNNDGWQDVYVTHYNAAHEMHIHQGTAGLAASTYTTYSGPSIGGWANGVTFGDVDNDGDLDMFLCNQARLYLNQTNKTNAPAYSNTPDGTNAEHYLGVMVAGASADKKTKTKDGIGSRVYLHSFIDYSESSYSSSNLIGMREIDGGSGYGSQATQIQHFGLSTTLGSNPHKNQYTVHVKFANGDEVWRYKIVPDSVRVKIAYNSGYDTTVLEQVVEITNANLVEKPYADPASTSFTSYVDVRLFSATPNANIYYTTDGSTPTIGSTPYNSSSPIRITETTTLKAFAHIDGWIASEVMTETYTRTSTTSQLVILDSTGNTLQGNILYTDQTAYTLKITTNYYGDTLINPGATTIAGGDSETLSLNTITGSDGSFARIYQQTFAFKAVTATSSNGILEAANYDTITVSWTNPLDNNDSPSYTVYVQPRQQEANVYFSTTNALSDQTTAFGEGTSPIWVIVEDQTPSQDSLAQGKYQITLTTRSSDIDGLTNESETLTLSLVNGYLVAQIPVSYASLAANDGTLQAMLDGDFFTASYSDPLDTSDVNRQASASYAKKTVTAPTLPSWTVGTDINFFLNDTTVAITNNTATAAIRYTINSVSPDPSNGTVYDDTPLFLNATSTIRAIAYFFNSDKNYTSSAVVVQTYNLRGQIGLPTANPATSYFTDSVAVTLTPAGTGDVIYYTTDNSDPTSSPTRILYSAAVSITQTDTLKFYAINGSSTPSPVGQEIYTKRITLDPPVATPPGADFSGSISVSLSNPVITEALIRYTLDGNDPTELSPVFSSAVNLNFTGPTTLKARAYPPTDAYIPSAVMTETYTPTVSAPTANPVSGTSFKSLLVSELSTSTYGASIYYTLDGSTPDTSSQLYNGLLRFTSTITFKAIAAKQGWNNSTVLTVTYTKQLTPSTLQILDANYQEVSYLSEQNSTFTVLVSAAEPDLSTITPLAITRLSSDSETLTLSSYQQAGDMYLFSTQTPFSLTQINPGLGDHKIQAGYYDSLIVTWVNPNNSSDWAADTIRVRPYPVQSSLYFSETLAAGTPVTQYNTEVDSLYLIIEDQKSAPGQSYTATLITLPLYGERNPDTLSVIVQELSPGIFGISIPVENALTNTSGDNLLQLLKGDGITAYYTDPIDGDSCQGNVKYSTAGDVAAEVIFTDENGTPLSDAEYWDPGNDSIYITYIDDFTDVPQTLTLIAENTTGTGRKTLDTITVTFPAGTQTDSIGTWRVAVPLTEADPPDDSTSLEVFFFGEVTALVSSHNRDGLSGQTVKDELNVAKADEQATIALQDVITGSDNITRATSELILTITDQNFTSQKDTILANLFCLESGDKLDDVRLIETDDGNYRFLFTKDEGEANSNDTILNCQSEDDIRVSYIDPIYGTSQNFQTGWQDNKTSKIYFLQPGTEDTITSLNQYTDSSFIVVVEAISLDKNKIDTLTINVSIENGETISVMVVETDIYSGIYKSVETKYSFVISPSADNDILEAGLDISSPDNAAVITASIISSGDTISSTLNTNAAFIPPEEAWIRDGNSDGIADTIYVKFKDSLPEKPAQITSIDWPAEGVNDFAASSDEISFFINEDGTVDKSIIVIVLSDDEFLFGATAPSQTLPPSLTLPEGNLFAGIKVPIKDRVGPVITEAVKNPSNLNYYKDATGMTRRNPDTLIITFSEKVIPSHNTGTPWDSLIMFVSPNENKENAHALINLVAPKVIEGTDSLQWMFIVTNEDGAYKPKVDDLIFMNPEAPYTDNAPDKNIPQDHAAQILGEEPKGNINRSNIFVPVEGISIGDPSGLIPNITFDDNGKVIFGNNTKTVTDNSGNIEVIQEWLKPIGLNSDGTINSSKQICDEPEEVEPISIYPKNCLSTVQVFSKERYIAEIVIFDHLGKYVHSSIQRFGYCGETENAFRRTSEGLVSWLVWNQKDLEKNHVGTGVYLWKVKFISPDGTHTGEYRQGIARSVVPGNRCAE
ncbi:MAG: chitobiase/beta-hexosaminidase C-terminal domain-containing protein [Fibrobacteria bacterium]|nr:chitobiase/beta-hexosaminidase C-terminal domain-containing protein [Fibrobacteria bacterium]